MIVNAIAGLIGALGALLYICFLAYKIDAAPLWVIVIGSMALMVFGVWQELREERVNRTRLEQHRADNGTA